MPRSTPAPTCVSRCRASRSSTIDRAAPRASPRRTAPIEADLVVAATGAPGSVARALGAERDAAEPFGLAIRAYVESPRHDDEHLEACLTIRDPRGTWVPGYGWMFPCGDGTVNIGVGALSTMKGFKGLNLNHLLDSYRGLVADSWEIGPNLERPRAWRLPMSAVKRHGPGWVAIGDAAGLVNPMNGEGIDYGLESGMLAADLFLEDPATAPERYDELIGERFDGFLRTGRRFAFLIGHPWLMRTGLRFAVGTQQDRRHHPAGDGQPGRLADARCRRLDDARRRSHTRRRRPGAAQDPRPRLIRYARACWSAGPSDRYGGVP